MYKRQVLHNVTDMEQLIQVQILAQNIIEFSNSMTAGLEAVLDNKLSPSLVPENLLRQDFRAFREHAAAEGLTPVIQDHKQVYQLTAFFIAKGGQPLQVYVRVPLKSAPPHRTSHGGVYKPISAACSVKPSQDGYTLSGMGH